MKPEQPIPPGPQVTPERLWFGRFVLDASRGCLVAEDKEIALRPRTFAVLQYFVDNPARLISKNELIAKVWHGGDVTDDALVQSVGELRRALGDDGPRIIRTVPRRGYRFDVEVVRDQPEAAHLPAQLPPTQSPVLARVALALALLAALSVGWILSTVPRRADAPDRPALAVLPFANVGGDPTRQHIADGLTDDIINSLGRFSGLTVLSWNAVASYRNAPAMPREVARSLSVRYQIEGSVQEVDGKVRVQARLVDAEGRVLGRPMRFDELRENLPGIPEKLSAQIAAVLAAQIERLEQHRVLDKPSGNPDAYDRLLRARSALRSPDRANIVEARNLLRSAIDIDPRLAAAWSALAETYIITVDSGWTESPALTLEQASEAAIRALDLDESDVPAHIALGRVHLFHSRHAEARAELDRALEINPNDANGLAGRGDMLLWLGQTDDAIESLEAAQRIDPAISFAERFALSLAYYLKGRYDDAISQARLNISTGNYSVNQIMLAVSYAQLGREEQAADHALQVRLLEPTFDPETFGTKLRNPADFQRLQDGLRKAGLLAGRSNQRSQ
jgi:adenylate cyclase